MAKNIIRSWPTEMQELKKSNLIVFGDCCVKAVGSLELKMRANFPGVFKKVENAISGLSLGAPEIEMANKFTMFVVDRI